VSGHDAALRVAITGGTGFVGGHLAVHLVDRGHEVVIVARSVDRRPLAQRTSRLPNARLVRTSVGDADGLTRAFAGCDAVAHCAGINREIGAQTYERVHVEGTANVVRAAERAGARRLGMLSFLRARPDCGSGYHETNGPLSRSCERPTSRGRSSSPA
jgi:nucleoside-diphosphate-sugar epimerase